MKELKECKCCNKPSKYKCPKCTINYCGSVCFKSHICTPIVNNLKKVQSQAIEVNINQDYIQDQQLRLPKSKLKKLKNYNIKTQLQSKKIRQMFQRINSSRQRIKQLQNCLADEQFRVFADTILVTLKVIDNEGRLV